MSRKFSYRFKQNSFITYGLALAIGLVVGYGGIPGSFLGLVYLGLGGVSIFFAFQRDLTRLFAVLPFMVYAEVMIRLKASFVPYLFMQYILLSVFIILILRQGANVKMHSRAFVLLILYAVIEFVDTARAHDLEYARVLTINTLLLALIACWGSFNIMRPTLINTFLNHVKTAAGFLCGYALVRQIQGGNSYVLTSMSEAINGLAAVQTSGYLGFSACVFFLSVMDSAERKNLMVNSVMLGINALVVAISFSRGGIYFLGIVMGLYFLFNLGNIKSYLLFVLLIPIGFAVYTYVTTVTHGLIIERYSEQGSSGRDVLIKAGFTLLKEEPLTGVGTSNFNTEIVTRGLFPGNSGAHNEFVRAAAEHGIIGIITYWGFFVVLVIDILARKKIQRDYAIYFLVLFCLISVHNGLKISIQPLILMLVVATPSFSLVKRKKDVRLISRPA